MSGDARVDPLESLLGRFDQPLPDSPHGLAALERSAAAIADALHDASRRIDRAIERAARPVSRGEEQAPADPDAELIAALRSAAAAPMRSAGVRSGPGPVEIAQRRLDALLEPLLWASRAETRHRGRVVASSTMRWAGDVQTRISGRPASTTVARHARRLGLVARQRRSRLQLIAVVVAGLTRLAASAASGGGLTALPALLRFIEQVLGALDTVKRAEAGGDDAPTALRAGAR